MRWLLEKSSDLLFARLALARQAVAARPYAPELAATLGRALIDTKQFVEAEEPLRTAIAARPDDPELRVMLARCLLVKWHLREAEQELDTARALRPDDPAQQALREALGRRRQRQQFEAQLEGDPQSVVAVCHDFLGRHPGDTNALYNLIAGLVRAGRPEEARSLVSLDRDVDVSTLPVPAGFGGRPEFLAALKSEILNNPTLVRDPTGKATRGGLQTGSLLIGKCPAVKALLDAFRGYIDRHAADLGEGPWTGGRPDIAKITAWAVVYERMGMQKSHYHPSGWLSGVFYVAGTQGPDGKYPGPLVVGADSAYAGEGPWLPREIEPKPGQLVLFPSFVPHQTRPFEQNGERIVVAFDVVPADAPPDGD
jgi:hypothetical protein